MKISHVSMVLITLNLMIRAHGSQCLDGSEKNQTFIRTIQTSISPLIAEFRSSTAFKMSEGRMGCGSAGCNPLVRSLNLPEQISEIPKECIRASLKRKVVQTSYECRRQPDGNWQYVKHTSRSKVSPCYDDSVVDYTHHITNKVISCFQGLDIGNGIKEFVDPKLLYSKLNNETGFNFNYSYTGGTGAGQLTSWAIREMNVVDAKGTPGQGRYILDAVLNSTNPACQGLKPIIRNDKKFRYQKAIPRCEWTSLETGWARNLVYSLGFFSFLKHSVIGKELKKYAPTAYKDPEILNLLALTAYGPGGRREALVRMRMARMNVAGRSMADVKKQLRAEKYLAATDSKMKEVKRIAGDSCRLL